MRQCFFGKKLCALLGGYLLLMLLLDKGNIDIWLATKFYTFEGYQWALKDSWLTEELLLKGARKLNYLLASAVLFITAYYLLSNKSEFKSGRAYLALSVSLICSFALVAYFKAITNVACPSSLTLFGGTEPYIHLLQARPSYLPYSRCFPAGHASIGYAWIALYYFFQHTRPEYRFIGLATGLTAGLILGVTQQLRGAHFVSHDVTTLMLCFLSAKFCFMLLSPASIKTKQHPL